MVMKVHGDVLEIIPLAWAERGNIFFRIERENAMAGIYKDKRQM